MRSSIYDLLMIDSLNLDALIEDYRVFFLSLIPTVFLLACIVEYFDRMDVLQLIRRGLIAILILTSVTSFYKSSIKASINAADEKMREQKQSNVLLMDMFQVDNHLNTLEKKKKDSFFKNQGIFKGAVSFVKHQFFGSFINDGFTISIYFIAQLCFILIKVVYSLVYYMGFGLIGIPCLVYLFPSMGNVLRGGILSYLWCLIVPHVLVFVLSLIGSEINNGYQSGQLIGGSVMGTALLFIMTLFIAFTPFITMMLINGSGIAQAGGIVSLMGGNYIKSIPQKVGSGAFDLVSTGYMGPKMKMATGIGKFGLDATRRGVQGFTRSRKSSQETKGQSFSSSTLSNSAKNTQKSRKVDLGVTSLRNLDVQKGGRNRRNLDLRSSNGNSKEKTHVQSRSNKTLASKVSEHRRSNQGIKKATDVNRSNRSVIKPRITRGSGKNTNQRTKKRKV